jgi:hypothetical protein
MRVRTACVVARLPADSSTKKRSCASSTTCILPKTLTWSGPALVRESEANTSPCSTEIATQ